MGIQYYLTNPEVLEQLKPTETVNTKVISAEVKNGNMQIKLEITDIPYDPDDPRCLFPLTKNNTESH